MKKLILILTILLNLNAIIISSFHNHIHYSKFDNCLILNFQNNNYAQVNNIEIHIEEQKILFELTFNLEQKYISQIILISPDARSPPIIS